MPAPLEKPAKLHSVTERRQHKNGPAPGERHRFWLWLTVCLVFAVGGYFWMTSAKMLGDPIELGYGPQDATFVQSMGPLLGADYTNGNSIQTLINGERFFPVMLEEIRHAQKTITLETYIWTSGKISDEFIAALSERAQHGVKVHVLADGMGTLKLKKEDRKRMIEGGIEFMTYGREHWYDVKPNINHRTHRKILVVDGRVGFAGGMCIDDHWLGNADSDKVWRETEIRIEGPVVQQMQATFAANWLQTTSHLLVGPEYFPKAERAGHVSAECYKSGPNEDPENARIAYMMAIASARKSIRIANAYFVPDDLAEEMLIRARKRGVQVQVIVPAINDSRIGRAASRSRWGRLLEAGVEFYRYTPAMYHAKVMIVDDVFVTIGSVNFDNRSFAINDEVGVNIIDPDVARDHLKSFGDDLKRSTVLTREEFESRPSYQKALDKVAGLLRSQL